MDKMLLITNIEAYLASDWTFDLGESNVLKLGQEEWEVVLCHQKNNQLVGSFLRKVTWTWTCTASVSSWGERSQHPLCLPLRVVSKAGKVRHKQWGPSDMCLVHLGPIRQLFSEPGLSNWDGSKTVFPEGSCKIPNALMTGEIAYWFLLTLLA